MADITIPQLNAATSVSGTDVMVISQAGVTKKVEVDKVTEKVLSSSVDILHMNPNTVQTLANVGELAFNPDTQTLEVKCSADVTLSIGQENYIRGKNAESSTILNGTVVYVSGGIGANSLIKRAGNADGTAERVIGVATQDIGANNIGFITTSGVVNKFDTSAYLEGDLLWLGTNGAMTNVKPDTSVDQICIGVVLRAHATEGSILVAVKDDWRDKLAEVRSDLSELEQEQIQGGVYDVSAHNDGAVFESLSTLLGSTNLSTLIPTSVRRGGMSIRFIQGSVPNSNNRYVQYLCNSQTFTTDETGWKKVATQEEIDKLRLDGYTFCGFALKTDTPATLYGNGYYIALQKGVYPNFGNLEVTGNNSLLNLLCWDSYNNRWWLRTGITIANIVEDENPFVVTSQAVYDKITEEITPLKKNKYLSVDNGVYNKLTELYLYGVDKTHSYRLDYFGYNNGAQWAFIYDVNTDTRVAYIADDTLSKEIIPLTADNNSGVSGYIMMNVQATTTDERVSGSIINLDVVTNKSNSPCIASINPFVSSNWNGIGDSIKELYLYGLNPIGNYTIKYCGYDPVNNRDCLFIYNSNNTLVAYMLDATRSKGIVPIISDNSIISGYIIKDFKETATDQRQEAKLNVANASNRALSPIIYKEESVVIAADGTGDYTSLTEGIRHAVGMRYANVIVKDGNYDIIAEHKSLYGDDFFTNYIAPAEATSYKRGIFLKNNINITFSEGAKVFCDNTSGNDASKKDFSPFNSGEYGFTIKGLNIYAKCTRYCVHDERNSEEDSYANHYINCYLELDNSQNYPWSFRGCIGGGLGCYGNIIVENCRFKSEDAIGRAIVSWHNTAANKGKSLVVIKDCYFYGQSSVYIHYYGTSTDISTMMVSNCSFGIAPLPIAPEGTATVENVELIAWNNEIRQ